MKIEIKNGEGRLVVSDEGLDNDNYVNVLIASPENDMIEADFLLSDLMPALIAFDAKRSRRLSDEQLMD